MDHKETNSTGSDKSEAMSVIEDLEYLVRKYNAEIMFFLFMLVAVGGFICAIMGTDLCDACHVLNK